MVRNIWCASRLSATMTSLPDAGDAVSMPNRERKEVLQYILRYRKMKYGRQKFKVIIVEDVKLELKGTEEIFRHEIPNAEVIGTAMTEQEFWTLIEAGVPDLVLLDLGLGGSTTIGVDICRNIFKRYPGVHVLIFTGEILNEKLWVDVLEAGADGIILKTGELLTKTDVQAVMDGKKLVFNYPILRR